MHYLNGDVYTGVFVNDKRQGSNGRLTFSDGSEYVGDFNNDKASGGVHSSFTDTLGNVYTAIRINKDSGYFHNGRLYGMGRIQYVNGDTYEGEMKDGKCNGEGVLKSRNLWNGVTQSYEEGEYKGRFKAGKRHGKGEMVWLDGSRFEGEWDKGERKKGRMQMIDGTVYEGEWKGD